MERPEENTSKTPAIGELKPQLAVRVPGRIPATGGGRQDHSCSAPRTEEKTREINAYRLDRLEAEVLAPARGLPSAEQRLRCMITSYVTVALTDPGIMVLLSAAGSTAADASAVEQHVAQFIRALEDELSEIMPAQRRATAIDSEVAAQSLLGLIHWGVCSHRAEGRLSRDEAAAQITFLSLHGLVAQPPDTPGRWNVA